MKKYTPIVLAILMVLSLTGLAAAGPEALVNVGTVQMSAAQWTQLKALVAGAAEPAAVPPAVEPPVNMGRVQLSGQEAVQIRAMVNGTYSAPDRAVVSADGTRNVGRVEMGNADYEALKQLVKNRRA